VTGLTEGGDELLVVWRREVAAVRGGLDEREFAEVAAVVVVVVKVVVVVLVTVSAASAERPWRVM
jgi:hypothetical protein